MRATDTRSAAENDNTLVIDDGADERPWLTRWDIRAARWRILGALHASINTTYS
jgi:hypothetical protein